MPRFLNRNFTVLSWKKKCDFELEVRDELQKIKSRQEMIKTRQEMIFTKEDQIQFTLHGETKHFQSPPTIASVPFTSPTTSTVGFRLEPTAKLHQSSLADATEFSSELDPSDFDSLFSLDRLTSGEAQAGTSQHAALVGLAQHSLAPQESMHPGTQEQLILSDSLQCLMPQQSTLAGTPQQPALAVIPQQSTLAGTLQQPALAGTSQQSTLVGTLQQPALAGTLQQPALAGTSQQSTLVGTLQQPALAGTLQQSTLAGTPQQPALAGTPQQSTLAGTPQQSTLAGTPQHPILAGNPQQPALAGTPQQLTLSRVQKLSIGRGAGITRRRISSTLIDPSEVIDHNTPYDTKDIGRLGRALAVHSFFGESVLRASTPRGDSVRKLLPLDPEKLYNLCNTIQRHPSFSGLSMTKKKIIPSISHYCKELRTRHMKE